MGPCARRAAREPRHRPGGEEGADGLPGRGAHRRRAAGVAARRNRPGAEGGEAGRSDPAHRDPDLQRQRSMSGTTGSHGVRPAPARRAFIETWGCQMNELDSQRMAGQLMQQGVLPTRDPEDADLILLNSCSVRDKAEQKVYSRLGEYRLLKETRRGLLIGLCGCVAQQEGERALSRVPRLAFGRGPAGLGELQEVAAEARAGRRVVRTGFPEQRAYDIDAVARHGEYKGMVTIVEGCNKRCTFCIVPQTRGPERSRPLAEIVREIEHLLAYGFVEIELLGQTVNHWREPAPPAGAAEDASAVAATADADGH